MTVQLVEDLDRLYEASDPWNYETTPDDNERKNRLVSLLPVRHCRRALDIGCGNGFVTVELPAAEIVGIDISSQAIRHAQARLAQRRDAARFDFRAGSLFDLSPTEVGTYDLVLITGVLYPQYIGSGFSMVRLIIDDLLDAGGHLVSCHIDEWSPWRFPYTTIDVSYYRYRDYTHRLEVLQK